MIRINNQYLKLSPDTDIIIDKQAKLLGEMDQTQGDFAYSFDFPNTTKNLSILGFPFPDVADKSIYGKVPCDLVSESGVAIYSGVLRVEKINSRTISASFFSGNHNWLSLIDGNLSDMDWSEYDTDITTGNITTLAAATEGITFPLVDIGGLVSRSTQDLKVEDFTGALYVKSIFRKVLNRAGLKFTGDLTNDWLFNNMVVLKNNKNQLEIEESSCFVEKTTTSTRPTENVDYKITWQNDSTDPFFDGENDAFDLANSKYVAPYKMTIDVECTLQASATDANYNNRIHLYINGAFTFVDIGLAVGGLYNSATPGDQEFFTIKRTIDLDAGDELEIYSHWQESTGSTTPISVLTGKLRITPVFIYQVFGSTLLPQWTKKEFLLRVLNLFNVISDFDPVSKTVTFNLFEKLGTKEAIDISKYIDPSTIEINFEQFISNFGRKNYLSYKEGEDEDLKEYRIKEFTGYGAGTIEVDNYYIPSENDIIKSAFTSPISYFSKIFGASFERVNLIQMNETTSVEFSAVSTGATYAKFTIPDDYYLVGDLVRVKDSTFPDYNGDWLVTAVTAGFVEINTPYQDVTATGKISKLNHRYTNNENVFLLVNIPNAAVSEFTEASTTSFNLEGVAFNYFAYAYFNLLNVGNTVNTSYKQGLSFGEVENTLSYQKTLIDTYWRSVGKILNDPVQLTANFLFPVSVFQSLTPLVPVHLKTKQTSNTYYINRIRGYINSHTPCEVELIKI